MNSKLRIETNVRRLINYIEDIEKGLVQIPAFQRDFVWTQKDKLELFESLKKEYPIGSILFWKPDESFGKIEKFGPYYIPQTNDTRTYILDGFQRLSTLFGCLVNPHKTQLRYDKDQWKKEYAICYDLDTEEFFFPRTQPTEPHQVYLYRLVDTFEFLSYSQELLQSSTDPSQAREYIERAKTLSSTLLDFRLANIEITGGSIEEAVDIFSRINSKGSQISPDWMVSALSYNENRNFRLGSIIDKLLADLEYYNFSRIKRDLVLQCITHSFGKAYFDQSSHIETLARRADFIPTAEKTIKSIKKAVDFLFCELKVIDSKLLPYNNQLIFITDFFNTLVHPSPAQLDELKRWFWITTYVSYFTIYSLSKQRAAYERFRQFLDGKIDDPIYNNKPDVPFSVVDFPSKVYFGSVRAKALVLFLLHHAYGPSKLEVGNVKGLNMNYLFYDVFDETGNHYPESVIPTIDFQASGDFQEPGAKSSREKIKDMSSSLEVYHLLKRNLDPFFLTAQMADDYQKNPENKLGIIQNRKNLIMQAEKAFTENLGLVYES